MFKIAIDFRKNEETHIDKLKNKGFSIGKNTDKSIWVFDIKYIYSLVAPSDKYITQLTLESKNKTYSIDIKDIEYFELQAK